MPDAGKNRSCVYLGDQQGQAGDSEDAPRRVQRRHEELHEPELGVVARQPHAPVDTGEVRREVVRVHGRDGRQRHGGHGEPHPAGPAARGQHREARRQEQRGNTFPWRSRAGNPTSAGEFAGASVLKNTKRKGRERTSVFILFDLSGL